MENIIFHYAGCRQAALSTQNIVLRGEHGTHLNRYDIIQYEPTTLANEILIVREQ